MFHLFYFLFWCLKGIAVLAANLTAGKKLRFGLIAILRKYKVFSFVVKINVN